MKLRNKKLIFILAFGLFSSLSLALSGSLSPSSISERLKPMAKMRINYSKEKSRQLKEKTSNSSRTADSIYKQNCQVCHTTGIAGAPKLGSKKAWESRLDKGMDKLVYNAIHGIRAMPPRGNCLDCTDEEIKKTIEYILSKSK